MRIKQAVNKVPGGAMVVPLIIGATFNTFFPELLDIGGFTTGLARGSSALLGAFLVCMGAGLDIKGASKAVKIGGVITLTKFVIGVAVGLIVAHVFNDAFLGLSSLAVIGAMTNSNGGLYSALTGTYGNEKEVGAIAIVSMNDGPFLTMIALGTAGVATIPLSSLVAVVIPILLGMVLGNLDKELRKALAYGGPLLIPFFSFALGTGINLRMIFEAGISGILLGLMVTFFGGFFTIMADKTTGGTGVAGAAISSTAGNAVATPAAVAVADPSMQAIANVATPQIAAAVITSAVCTPLLTNYIAKKNVKKNKEISIESAKTVETIKISR